MPTDALPRPPPLRATTPRRTATRPRSPRRSSCAGRSTGTPTARSRRRTRPARWPTRPPSPPAAPSCSCSTCSRTHRAPACTSVTRWASPAPTSTAATSGWPGATCCTRWASTPSGCRPSSSPCRPARTRRSPPPRTSPPTGARSAASGLSHDRRRSIDTTDPGYYRWTQWIFSQIFDSWYDPDAPNPAGGRGRARPIGELRAEFADGTRELDDGRQWSRLSPSEQAAVLDDYRLAYVSDAPVNWCPGLGTVVANEEVTADGRSDRGNFPVFKRNMRQWMMRITAYADRLLDDLDVLEWTDSLKTMQRNWIGRSTGANVALPVAGRADHGVHDAPRHAVRRDVHGAGPRAPARRRPDDVGGGAGRAGVPPPGRDAQGRRPPGREPRQDGRVHRQLRHQPGHRPRHPDLDRRLRADGLRHRGDHGRAVRATSATSSSPGSSGSTSRRSSDRPTSGSPPAASSRRSTPTAGRRRSSATRRTSTRPTTSSTSTASDVGRSRRRRDQRLAGGQRASARRRSPTSCATGCSAASGTGASRSRSSTTSTATRTPCPTTCCRCCCPTPTTSRRGRSTPTTSTPSRRARSTA